MTATEIKSNGEILDKLICDYGPTKYRDIVWAMEWARHLRWDEESRRLPMAEMIEKAMLEVISGKITPKAIIEAINRDMAVAEKITEKKEDSKKSRPGKKEDKGEKEKAKK